MKSLIIILLLTTSCAATVNYSSSESVVCKINENNRKITELKVRKAELRRELSSVKKEMLVASRQNDWLKWRIIDSLFEKKRAGEPARK